MEKIKSLLLFPKVNEANLYIKNLKEALSKEVNIINYNNKYDFFQKAFSKKIDIIFLNWFENVESKNRLKM